MVKKHGKKQRAKQRSRRTGAAHASAAANTLHNHPEPDTGLLAGMMPYVPGWEADDALATRLVAACWAACMPCQKSIGKQVVAHRATLAGLAGTMFLTQPDAVRTPTPLTGGAAREWIDQAHGKAFTAGAETALRAVQELEETAAADLLDATLDLWAMSGTSRPGIGLADRLTQAPPRQRPADPMDAFRKAGINVVTLDDLDLGDVDAYHLAPNYGVMPMKTTGPDGHPMPMLLLYPETEDAGIEDLEARTDWEHWGLHGMPHMDPLWRVRARIADRSLQGLVHVGPDGDDAVELWRAAESVSLPAAWWDLLDRVQHVLVVGPVPEPETPGALKAEANAGRLLAVVARVAFA
ncbi:hypothetical protein EV284_6437 [Streptomyces sp. BK022]|uniref:hypothetical protein n=1 Tax=Streptomyces sp. BK022 TaxID=2512123 RepID=UPI0010291449|nr:hypothetical protein [Streptomyces sp. BK022]RZU28271.1 hypothetical protein EV284_6437 [Streptomyces sp. BK022]